MGYSNEINVANEMTNSRRAMKRGANNANNAAPLRRKMDKSTGFVYYVTKHLDCPSQVGPFFFVQGFFYRLYSLNSSHGSRESSFQHVQRAA